VDEDFKDALEWKVKMLLPKLFIKFMLPVFNTFHITHGIPRLKTLALVVGYVVLENISYSDLSCCF
jgi:hypothetical protein